MNIVETFSVPSKNKSTYLGQREMCCKNIISRLSKVGEYKLLPNVNDYGHGVASEIEYEGVKMLLHHYQQIAETTNRPNPDAIDQYELSIEYTTI